MMRRGINHGEGITHTSFWGFDETKILQTLCLANEVLLLTWLVKHGGGAGRPVVSGEILHFT